MEWSHAIVVGRAGLHVAPRQVFHNSDMASLGGKVNGLGAVFGNRLCVCTRAAKVLCKSDMATDDRGV